MRAMRSLALVLVAAAGRVAVAAPCPPTAVLEGEPTLVDRMTTLLARREVSTTPQPTCPPATVRLDQRGASTIVVTIVDASGRRSERMFSDPDAAAALIASWARQDENALALVGFVDPVEPPASPAPLALRGTTPAPARAARFSVVAAGEVSNAFDNTQWIGARAGACVTVGPLCVGAIGRIASRAESRSAYDALASVEVPIPISRRLSLRLGVGVGYGWLDTIAPNDARDPARTSGLRLDGRAGVSFPLARLAALQLGASISASPSSPSSIASGGEGAALELDDPSGYARVELGLRIGAP